MKSLNLGSVIVLVLFVWYFVHIHDGINRLQKASNACDPLYWLGSFSNAHIANGFTNDSHIAYEYSEGFFDNLGQMCFWTTSRLFHVVNPDSSFARTQLFNPNEYMREYKVNASQNK